MRVGIIGSSQVGQTLASGFLQKGHEVTIGTRDPAATLASTKPDAMGKPPLSAWAKANPKVKIVTMAECAKQAEVVVLCVHGANIEAAVKAAGPENLAGKLVFDTTNPLDFGPNGAHVPKSIPDSCIQVAQRAAPNAHFVKALNCTPGHLMVDPKMKGDQFICGNDAKAKEQAAAILKAFGWTTRDVGDVSMGPYVEGMALAAINWAAKANDWNWVLKVQQ